MKRWSFYREKDVREVLTSLREDFGITKGWIIKKAEEALSEAGKPRKGVLEITLWGSGDYNFPEFVILRLYPVVAGRNQINFDAEIVYVRHTNMMGDEYVVPLAYKSA